MKNSAESHNELAPKKIGPIPTVEFEEEKALIKQIDGYGSLCCFDSYCNRISREDFDACADSFFAFYSSQIHELQSALGKTRSPDEELYLMTSFLESCKRNLADLHPYFRDLFCKIPEVGVI